MVFSSLYISLTGALSSSSAPTSTPSTPPNAEAESSSNPPSDSPASHLDTAETATAPSVPSSEEIGFSSAFYRKLVERNKHSPKRLLEIRRRAIEDRPPKEPSPEECCGEACGLECVTTVWWEEEKTWRDLHPDWRSIKASIAAEEEDLRRAREEEEALNGGPEVAIAFDEQNVDREETEEDVMDQVTNGWKG